MGDEALLGFDLSILSGRESLGDVIDGLSLPAAPVLNLVPSQRQEENNFSSRVAQSFETCSYAAGVAPVD